MSRNNDGTSIKKLHGIARSTQATFCPRTHVATMSTYLHEPPDNPLFLNATRVHNLCHVLWRVRYYTVRIQDKEDRTAEILRAHNN